MNYGKKYRYFASLDGGRQWYELRLKKQVDLTYKKEKGQGFYRVDSADWEFARYQNVEFFSLLSGLIEDPETIKNELLVKIEYYKTFTTLTKILYNGYVPLNGFSLDIDSGQCKMKPKKQDEYTWYDKTNEIQVELSSLTPHLVVDFMGEKVGDHFMKLFEIMNHLLTFHGSGLTFESELLSNTTSPMDGQLNGYSDLLIQGNGYFLPELPDNYILQISLKDLVDLFVKGLNCQWVIQGGKFKVEHLRYFKNGMNYSGSQTVGIDLTNSYTYPWKYQVLTDTSGISTANRFSYPVDGFPASIAFKWGWSSRIVNLSYTNPLVSKDKNEEATLTKFEVDPEYVRFALDQIEISNYFLASCEPGNIVGNYKLLSATAREEYPNTLTPNYENGHLYFDRLLRILFVDDSYFTTGKINGYDQNFLSKKRIKQQEDLRFPHLEDFDISDLVKTNFGNGEVQTLKHNLDTGFIQTTLLFECKPTGQGALPVPEEEV